VTQEPCWIAHRGGLPENALSSLVSFLKPGGVASGIEFDVQLTSDRVPVIFHDYDTERLTGESGPLVERSWQEVSRLRSQGEPIPRLTDLASAILALPPTSRLLNVEFKPTARARELIQAASPFFEAMSSIPNTELVLSSFDPRVVDAVMREQPGWRIAYLYEDVTALEALPYFPKNGTGLDLHPKHNLLTEAHIEEYGQASTTFRTWTVDDPLEAHRILGLGVSQIITNDPNALAAATEEELKS